MRLDGGVSITQVYSATAWLCCGERPGSGTSDTAGKCAIICKLFETHLSRSIVGGCVTQAAAGLSEPRNSTCGHSTASVFI